MPDEKDFCCVGNFPVLIPYKEPEKLLKVAQNQEEMLAKYRQMEKRCAKMQLMYSEILEKLAEIDKLL